MGSGSPGSSSGGAPSPKRTVNMMDSPGINLNALGPDAENFPAPPLPNRDHDLTPSPTKKRFSAPRTESTTDSVGVFDQ